MPGPSRPSTHRRRPFATVGAVLVLAALAIAALGTPAPVTAASYPIRIEAGPQTGYHFGSSGAVTGTRTLTFRSPVNTTASDRRSIGTRGQHILVAGGPMAGWWLRESGVAFVRGYVGTTDLSPTPAISLEPGRYEVYRFDAAGSWTDASLYRIPTATTVHVDQRARINGRAYLRLADGPMARWWLPGTTTAISRIGCTAGGADHGTTGKLVTSVPSATGKVALTLDMGGRLDPAVSIVRFLVVERQCTTFFVTGDASETAVGRQVLAMVSAHPELFELGNHTVHHCNLRYGGGAVALCPDTRPTDAFATQELEGAETIVEGIAGMTTKPYWRPPYGSVDGHLVNVAAAAGYPWTVMWSVDTIDWKPVKDGGPTAADSIAKVRANVTPGGIVLMHLGGYTTRDALPGMVAALRAKGYSPTSITGLGG
jgi:peptidoglycan/xylan/chitin deacetylase (PgdA/CDA1 family)